MSAGSSSGLAGAIFFGILFVVRIVIRHSGSDGSELLEPMEKMLEHQRNVAVATQTLTQELAKVQDADSAIASVDSLQAAFDECQTIRDSIDLGDPDISIGSLINMKISEATAERMDEIGDEMTQAAETTSTALDEMVTEIERIEKIPEMSAEFWNSMRGVMASHAAIAFEDKEYQAYDDEKFSDAPNPLIYQKLASLIEKHGSQQVMLISMTDLSSTDFSKACSDLRSNAGNGVRIDRWYSEDQIEGHAIFSPTEDFQTFIDKMPEGTFTVKDEARRTISMKVKKLREEVPTVVAQPTPPKAQQKFNAVAAQSTGKVEVAEAENNGNKNINPNPVIVETPQEVQPELPPEQQQPGESETDYYSRLAGLMIDQEEPALSNKAIETILAAETGQIGSKKTRGQIARNFRQLAMEDQNRTSQGKAIQGLTKFGGKYCVPVLLEMLENEKVQAQDDLYAALAQYPHEQTAVLMTSRLKESNRDDKAIECLRAMGSLAEIPLIKLARTDDQALTLVVVELLGDVGTKKSFALIRKHSKSKDKKLSEAAKASTMKIRKRIQADKIAKAA